MRQWQNYVWDTISRIGGWGTNTKIIKTETLLHLNLEIFIFFFIYLFIYFYFESSLCLSDAFSAYSLLVHCLSLFISLKLFCLLCFFLLVYFFFPFPLASLLSTSSHPSILNITSAIITSHNILNCTQYRDSNNTKCNDGKTETTGKPVSPQQKLVQEPEGNEENRYSDPDSNKM
jgi:hypothetical protein